ncbi:MAG: hypothetical protein GY793_00935 [Proteobacteria bacterium]|nr:hypothetical protein [Pseudomonadota bacterium]
MINKTILALCTLISFTVIANAEESIVSDSSETRQEHRKFRSDKNKGDEKAQRNHSDKNPKHIAARKECAAKCGINKEHIKKCRRAKKQNGEKMAKGSCLNKGKKSCLKACMKSKRPKHKKGKEGNRSPRHERMSDSTDTE